MQRLGHGGRRCSGARSTEPRAAVRQPRPAGGQTIQAPGRSAHDRGIRAGCGKAGLRQARPGMVERPIQAPGPLGTRLSRPKGKGPGAGRAGRSCARQVKVAGHRAQPERPAPPPCYLEGAPSPARPLVLAIGSGTAGSGRERQGATGCCYSPSPTASHSQPQSLQGKVAGLRNADVAKGIRGTRQILVACDNAICPSRHCRFKHHVSDRDPGRPSAGR